MKRLRLDGDVGWACAVAIAVVAGTLLIPGDGGGRRSLDALAVTLLVLPSLATALRHRAPLTLSIIGTVSTPVYYSLDYPGPFAAVPAMVGIYRLAVTGRRAPAIALGVALSLGVFMAENGRSFATREGYLWMAGWTGAMIVFGEMTRNRRAFLEAAEQRAAEAERTREEAALRRAGEERLWIAQELHDALTHSISVINVQAGMAVHLVDRDPGRSREALAAIREAGQEAMRELRGTLGVLRQVDTDDAPGLDRLPRLVDRARSTGLTMTHEVRGEPRALPADVDRAAYRILQEALTNVLRHAGHVPVSLTTEYRADGMTLEVANDPGLGRAPAAGTGMGLIGMRERALAVGGSLTAGPGPDGRFRVVAELPL